VQYRFFEEIRSNFNISPITKRAIDSKGLGVINFRDAILNYPNSLKIRFTVRSSDGKGEEQHTSSNGDPISRVGGYKTTVECTNFGSIAPPNFLNLPLSQQINYIKEIFDKSDLKFDCTCPAFYWQGNSELLDNKPPDANLFGFTGTAGTGEWDKRHNTKNRICKHIYHVLENLDSYVPKIIKKLNSGTTIDTVPRQQPQQIQVNTPPRDKKEQVKSASERKGGGEKPIYQTLLPIKQKEERKPPGAQIKYNPL
jgi:hypothetical protein